MGSKTLNLQLHEGQLEVFNCKKRYKILSCGRRWGKTYLAASWLLVKGMETHKDGRDITKDYVAYMAPVFDQAKKALFPAILSMGRDIIKSYSEKEGKIRLLNGRTILITGAEKPDNLRGPGLSAAVLDEYAFMRPEVWVDIIKPALMVNRGEALFLGTPKYKNHYYELFLAAQDDDDWQIFQSPSWHNPLIPKEEIEQNRKTMTVEQFAREVEGKFTNPSSEYFSEAQVQMVEGKIPPGTVYVTLDPAGYESTTGTLLNARKKRLDETAICVCSITDTGEWYVLDIQTGRWDVLETAKRAVDLCVLHGARALGVEKGSLKNAIMPFLTEYMRKVGAYTRILDLTHGGQKKSQRIMWALQSRLQNGAIKFRDGEYLRKFKEQLVDFPSPLSHDDMVDALSYMEQMYKPSFGINQVVDTWKPIDFMSGY